MTNKQKPRYSYKLSYDIHNTVELLIPIVFCFCFFKKILCAVPTDIPGIVCSLQSHPRIMCHPKVILTIWAVHTLLCSVIKLMIALSRLEKHLDHVEDRSHCDVKVLVKRKLQYGHKELHWPHKRTCLSHDLYPFRVQALIRHRTWRGFYMLRQYHSSGINEESGCKKQPLCSTYLLARLLFHRDFNYPWLI